LKKIVNGSLLRMKTRRETTKKKVALRWKRKSEGGVKENNLRYSGPGLPYKWSDALRRGGRGRRAHNSNVSAKKEEFADRGERSTKIRERNQCIPV